MTGRSARLLRWYEQNRRDLPWRGTDDPWEVLVAEVMLQQTQASRVAGRYREFLEQFPTARHLAEAGVRPVLKAWTGLGYNSRVLRLRDAAAIIERDGWPVDEVGLRELPGIGPYTAAAVACFAFGEQVPAVDTNLRRVLSRWEGRSLTGGALQEFAAVELPEGRAEDWNQAMMDLGSLLCTPRDPDCELCPVRGDCSGPDVYMPPRPQPRFDGSVRQARGAIIRTLTEQPTVAVADVAPELDPNVVEEALTALNEEGVVTLHEGRVSLSEAPVLSTEY